MSHTKATLMTDGAVWKRIIAFAVPLFWGNLFQQLYNTADSLIVGNFLDSNALAAVSSSSHLIFLLVGFFNGLSVGAGVVVGRYFGAKEEEQVQRAIHTTIAFGLAAGLLLTGVSVTLAPWILVRMGTPAEVLPDSVSYFRVYFAGSLAFVMYNIFVGILQAVGDSRHPLLYLVFSSLLNIVLDLIFIAGFGLGVEYAALATVISQLSSAFLCFFHLLKSPGSCRVSVRKIGFDSQMLRQIITNGLPAGVQNSIISVANVVVQANINHFGKMAMAGCGSYSKIEGFAFLPITCFALSVTTFVSQNLGARQYERARRGAWFGILCSCVLAELVGLMICFLSPVLIAAFHNHPEVISYGTAQARVVTLFYFLLAFSHCMAGVLRGAGKSAVPMLVMLFFWCIVRVSYITVTIRFIPDIRVIFWAYPLTWSLSSLAFLCYFLKADWLHGFDQETRR